MTEIEILERKILLKEQFLELIREQQAEVLEEIVDLGNRVAELKRKQIKAPPTPCHICGATGRVHSIFCSASKVYFDPPLSAYKAEHPDFNALKGRELEVKP